MLALQYQELYDFGWFTLRWIDLLDLGITTLLVYQVYKLLRGSIAINLFLGVLSIYAFWTVIRYLDMRLLDAILRQFLGLGVIAFIILFQPELRQFLLFLGRGRQFSENRLWRKYVAKDESDGMDQALMEVVQAMKRMAEHKIGALICLEKGSPINFVEETGIPIDAEISHSLLESIFTKNSALHDGAVVIFEGRIRAARCTLPVTNKSIEPDYLGIRHRAAVGVSERSDAVCLIVSEETGAMSIAHEGKLEYNVSPDQLYKAIVAHLK